jgi:hypothetical protein
VQLGVLYLNLVHLASGFVGLLYQTTYRTACLCPRLDFRRITANKTGLGRHGISFRLRPK